MQEAFVKDPPEGRDYQRIIKLIDPLPAKE